MTVMMFSNHHWNEAGENREVFMGVLTVSETVAMPAGPEPTSFHPNPHPSPPQHHHAG